MPRGIQFDDHSCGIITINTIEHGVLGVILWLPQRKIMERVKWFVRLARGMQTKDDDIDQAEV